MTDSAPTFETDIVSLDEAINRVRAGLTVLAPPYDNEPQIAVFMAAVEQVTSALQYRLQLEQPEANASGTSDIAVTPDAA